MNYFDSLSYFTPSPHIRLCIYFFLLFYIMAFAKILFIYLL